MTVLPALLQLLGRGSTAGASRLQPRLSSDGRSRFWGGLVDSRAPPARRWPPCWRVACWSRWRSPRCRCGSTSRATTRCQATASRRWWRRSRARSRRRRRPRSWSPAGRRRNGRRASARRPAWSALAASAGIAHPPFQVSADRRARRRGAGAPAHRSRGQRAPAAMRSGCCATAWCRRRSAASPASAPRSPATPPRTSTSPRRCAMASRSWSRSCWCSRSGCCWSRSGRSSCR